MGTTNNAHDQADNRRVSRRRFTQAVGGSALAGMAGCSGDGDGSDGGGGTPTDTSGGDGSNGDMSGSGEWKNLDGAQVHVLTEMGSTRAQQFWNDLATAFNEATGAVVNMEYVGIGTGYRERLTQLLQAGDPPEVTHTGMQDHVTFALNGQAGNLTPAVNYLEETYDTELTPEAGAVIFDDNHYLLPVFRNTNMYHFREDIVTGVGQDWPNTWDDVLTMAEEHDQGQGGLRAGYFPLGQNDCLKYYVISHGFTAGANICGRDSSGNVQIVMDNGENREAWIQAMDYWKEKAQYCMLDSQGGCSSMAGAIPAEVTFANQYFGNRPKIQSVEQGKSFASSVRERHMPRPEGGQDNPVLGLLQGVGSFAGANVEAANEYIKFLLQPQYFFDFLFLDPVHNAPILSEIANHQQYQQRLESMPDAWSQDDLTAQLSEENYMPFPAETDPPNPYTGALFASEPLWQLGYDVVNNQMDSGQAIDKAASALREVLSDAK